MFNSNKEWNISFAGCGFLGIYYFGVYSCLLEWAYELMDRTTKICGASSGALIGAMIVCQLSPGKCCEHLMELAKEARRGMLGSMHPSFDLLKLTRDLMVRELPDNAHILTSGRLCVSLTRVSDRENVLVSDFASKNDLIQALICSCFFPFYCGVIPPSYHGTRYVDGALSNNLPYYSLKNTITVSPFSGESDICPYDTPFYFQEIRHSNVSIQVNFANMHRVIQAFFPPEPEVLATMYENGYKDALNFLKENGQDLPITELKPDHKQNKCSSFGHCHTHLCHTQDCHRESIQFGSVEGENPTCDECKVYRMTEPMQKVFCKASEKKHGWFSELFVVRLTTFILTLCYLPVEVIYFMILRVANWVPEIASDLLWLLEVSRQVTGWVWKSLFS